MLTSRAKGLQTFFALTILLFVSLSNSKIHVIHNMDGNIDNSLGSIPRHTVEKDASTKTETNSHSDDSNSRRSSDCGILGESKSLDSNLKALEALQGSKERDDSDDTALMILKDLDDAEKTQNSRKSVLNLIESEKERKYAKYSDLRGKKASRQKLYSEVYDAETDQDNTDKQEKDFDQLQKYDSKNRFDFGTGVAQSRRRMVFGHGGETPATDAKAVNVKRILSIDEQLDELEKKEITDFSKSPTRQAKPSYAVFRIENNGDETELDKNGASESELSLKIDEKKVHHKNAIDKKRGQRIEKFYFQQSLHSESSTDVQHFSDSGVQVDEEGEHVLQEKKEADEDSRKSKEIQVPKVELRGAGNNREEKPNDDHESFDSDKFLELLKDKDDVDDTSEPYWVNGGKSGQLDDLEMIMTTGKKDRETGVITKQRRVANRHGQKSRISGDRKHHSMRNVYWL